MAKHEVDIAINARSNVLAGMRQAEQETRTVVRTVNRAAAQEGARAPSLAPMGWLQQEQRRAAMANNAGLADFRRWRLAEARPAADIEFLRWRLAGGGREAVAAAGGGGGEVAGGGLLREMKGMFGRGSKFGLFAKTLMGGGTLLGLRYAAQELATVSGAVADISEKMRRGKADWTDFAGAIAGAVPFAKEAATIFDNISSIIGGPSFRSFATIFANIKGLVSMVPSWAARGVAGMPSGFDRSFLETSLKNAMALAEARQTIENVERETRPQPMVEVGWIMDPIGAGINIMRERGNRQRAEQAKVLGPMRAGAKLMEEGMAAEEARIGRENTAKEHQESWRAYLSTHDRYEREQQRIRDLEEKQEAERHQKYIAGEERFRAEAMASADRERAGRAGALGLIGGLNEQLEAARLRIIPAGASPDQERELGPRLRAEQYRIRRDWARQRAMAEHPIYSGVDVEWAGPNMPGIGVGFRAELAQQQAAAQKGADPLAERSAKAEEELVKLATDNLQVLRDLSNKIVNDAGGFQIGMN